MRIVFLGTPEFAVSCLDALNKSKHEVIGVICQPDKPTERGNKIQFCCVKKYAIENNLKLFQFAKISRDGVEELKALNPDLMITAAYGQILSQEVLNIPKYGVINVHASLLPKYRGASPIQSAIIHGDTETGVTIMKTEIGLDTGDIIDSVKTPIFENETYGELSIRLSEIGANLLLSVIDRIEKGTVTYIKQEHFNATITNKISKTDATINWNKSSKEIKCLVLGTNPNPIARTLLNGEMVKIYKAKIADIVLTDEDKALEPGTVLPESSSKNGLFVRTFDGAVELIDIQFPGGRELPAKQILNGRKIKPLDKFVYDINV